MARPPRPCVDDQPAAGAQGGLDADLFALNLIWLLKAREAARSDPREAAMLFGLDQALSEMLRTASIEDLRQLAQVGLVVFGPRFSSRLWQLWRPGDAASPARLSQQWLMRAAEEAAER
jgi:hypothetical protein